MDLDGWSGFICLSHRSVMFVYNSLYNQAEFHTVSTAEYY